jgi:hypothetical protein
MRYNCRACGFDEDNQKPESEMDRLSFISVQGGLTVTLGSGYHSHVEQVTLEICPQCGTVRCNEWWCNTKEPETP